MSNINTFKISANIVCKDEKYWIEPSILSIVELVDEIIYVDDESTDGTLDIVLQLAKKYANIKIFTKENHKITGLGNLKNFAKNQSKNELVLRWDADFIAYDEISNLFKFATHNFNKYDAYVLNGPNLEGNIYHAPLNSETFGPECYLFKKDMMSFNATLKYNDYPVFAQGTKYCYPQTTSLDRSFFFIHTNKLKSLTKLAYRKRMSEFQNAKCEISYWEYVNPHMIKEESFNHEIKKVKKTAINIKEFDFEKWGQHPEILMQYESAKLFKVNTINDKKYLDNYPII